MHLLYANLGRALLKPRRRHPLDDPLDAPEWAGLWQVFALRAKIGSWARARSAVTDSGRTQDDGQPLAPQVARRRSAASIDE
jgi:hypothetical protein